MDKQQLYTVTQAAAHLGVTPIRVRQICQAENLGEKVGSVWIISGRDLRRFAAKRRSAKRKSEKTNG